MIRKLQIFFGPSRFRAFVALLAITGLTSLVLNAVSEESEQVLAVQTLLFVAFVLGAAYLVLGRLPLDERKRWLAIIAPSIIGIIVGSLVAPHLTGLFLGAGIGWIVAGIFIFRDSGGPENYKRAVKAMRKSDYQTAIAAMTTQIKEQPKEAEHYRFRAELHRLSGDLEAAFQDYERMTKIDAGSAVAYNGLAEVELQAGRYENALRAATKAHELAPDEWVAAYNLGMIEDRMQHFWESAITHLNAARSNEDTGFSTQAAGATILVACVSSVGAGGISERRLASPRKRACGPGGVASCHGRGGSAGAARSVERRY